MEASGDEPTDVGVADAVLIRQVVAGSHAALAALYDRHAAVVFTGLCA